MIRYINVKTKEELKELLNELNVKRVLTEETTQLNNPSHYQINGKDSMDTILEIVKENVSSTEEAVYLFNTLKYLVRYGRKDGIKDLLKAKDYLNRLIEEVEYE